MTLARKETIDRVVARDIEATERGGTGPLSDDEAASLDALIEAIQRDEQATCPTRLFRLVGGQPYDITGMVESFGPLLLVEPDPSTPDQLIVSTPFNRLRQIRSAP
jgi:hypothetical protein